MIIAPARPEFDSCLFVFLFRSDRAVMVTSLCKPVTTREINRTRAGAKNKMKSGLTLLCVTLLTEGLGSLTRVAGGSVSNDLIVDTKLGKIQGFETATSDNKKVSAWYGVPYAQPPVGNLRFRHPRPADPWEGVKKTHEHPNSCVQAGGNILPKEISKVP